MDDRTLLDLGPLRTGRTSHLTRHLFDHQLDVGAASLVVQDHHVFEAHQGREDLARVAKNEGASWLLGHTSSLKHLRRARGDPGQGATPPDPKSQQYAGEFRRSVCERL